MRWPWSKRDDQLTIKQAMLIWEPIVRVHLDAKFDRGRLYYGREVHAQYVYLWTVWCINQILGGERSVRVIVRAVRRWI
jgi:hypothetical protein